MSALPMIRAAIPGDLERLAWLEAASFAEPWPLDTLRPEILEPLALVLVAVAGDEPAGGYACFRHTGGEEAELLRIGVDPARRRRGIARCLVAHGLERLRAAGTRTCHLEVRTDNEAAITLYRGLDFNLVGLRRAYYRDGRDAFVFARPL